MIDVVSPRADAIVVAMHEGRYERNERDFMRLVVRPGMHVADVGAHIGFHTSHLAELVGATGSVIAFEPIEEHAGALSNTIAERRLEHRVRIVRAAVADSPGTRPMVVAGTAMAAANAYLEYEGRGRMRASSDDGSAFKRAVPVVTLDDAMCHRPAGFLKIDAEGAEALVLRGARGLLAGDRPVVLVDLHPHLMACHDGTTPAALIRDMADLGYECRLLGAGVPGSRVTDADAKGVTTVIFLQA